MALGWILGDIRGIYPTIVQHRIHLEDNAKAYCDRQRTLNPTLQEMVNKEILKWLDHNIIYLISDSEFGESYLSCFEKDWYHLDQERQGSHMNPIHLEGMH